VRVYVRVLFPHTCALKTVFYPLHPLLKKRKKGVRMVKRQFQTADEAEYEALLADFAVVRNTAGIVGGMSGTQREQVQKAITVLGTDWKLIKVVKLGKA
jgi:hypothetical protein